MPATNPMVGVVLALGLSVSWPASATDCPQFFFEPIGDLAGDAFSSTVADLSANGERAVGSSWADDPGVATDGGSGPPTFYPHAYQAVGYIRPCERKPFFQPPGGSRTGLIGFGYVLPSAHAESHAYGISPDGKVSVGFSALGTVWPTFTEAVTFEHGTIRRLGMLPGDQSSAARDVSDSVPHGDNPRFAAPAASSGNSSNVEPSRQPRIVVGWSSTGNNHPHRVPGGRAVYWERSGIRQLDTPAGLPNGATVVSAEAVAVSDDGSTIAGNLYFDAGGGTFQSYACVWTNELGEYGPAQVLDDLPGGDIDGRAAHISGDGQTLVGYGNSDASPFQACWWPVATGAPAPLDLWPDLPWGTALGVNEDGTVVVGYGSGPSDVAPYFEIRATLWRLPGSAPSDVATLLDGATPPVVLPSGWMIEAHRVSANGRVIVGSAWHPDPLNPGDPEAFVEQGWVGRIP